MYNFCSLGDSDCFLFTLKPSVAIYYPTAINDHYIYLNVGMKTIPNGLVSFDVNVIRVKNLYSDKFKQTMDNIYLQRDVIFSVASCDQYFSV